jgi:hypothetical protein
VCAVASEDDHRQALVPRAMGREGSSHAQGRIPPPAWASVIGARVPPARVSATAGSRAVMMGGPRLPDRGRSLTRMGWRVQRSGVRLSAHPVARSAVDGHPCEAGHAGDLCIFARMTQISWDPTGSRFRAATVRYDY